MEKDEFHAVMRYLQKVDLTPNHVPGDTVSVLGDDAPSYQVVIVAADSKKCVAELKIEEEHLNPMGTMHGGLAATLVDVISNVGLRALTGDKAHVSVSMNLSYLKAAKLGDEIVIESETLKAGRTLAYLLVTIKNKQTGDLLVKCSHTTFITNKELPID